MTCQIWRNWKKWKPIRDKILERDNYQCQFCEATFEQLKVQYRREKRLLRTGVHKIIKNVRLGVSGGMLKQGNYGQSTYFSLSTYP